ncbi:MAG: zf-HC2 domain-containing protein [Cyanobacteria bacterium J06638_28]
MSTSLNQSPVQEDFRLVFTHCAEHTAMSQQRELDVTKRDRFELLSAYLDGEVSPEERRLVTTWLAEDDTTQCLYRRLLSLRQGLQHLHTSEWKADTGSTTAKAVIRELNYRFRFTCMASLTAAAVGVVAVFSGALNQPIGRFANEPFLQPPAQQDNLEIALDQPVISIPRAGETPDSVPMDSVLPQ